MLPMSKRRGVLMMRVREVEKACFSPLVFSACGGMGSSATTIYNKMASMLADKWGIITVDAFFGLFIYDY